MRLFAISLVLGAWGAGAAAAQDVTVIGTHGKWTAYTYTENKQPVCYIAAKPDKSEGKYSSRDEVLMLVTHRPAEKAWDVISVVAGYQYKPDTDALLTIGAQKFDLFTTGADRAWARDSKTDRTIVQAMIKGNSAVVRGTSSRGTLTTDTFSLNGFTAAYKAISDTCKRPG
ncbi:MAG: invasion associated locus B family protein [Rhodospirillaceae bacterium]